MTSGFRRALARASLAGSLAFLAPVAPGADAKPKKPSLSVRVSPRMAFSPVSILAVAELTGGDDHEAFYCLGIEWDWDDGSRSSHDADCEPYREGAKIERRFTAEHYYSRAGTFSVKARLMNGQKVIAANSFRLTIRQGIPPGR